MNYIIFDLEFNQLEPQSPLEIIQIGAIKCDEKLNTLSEFSALVKPEIYSELQPFVQELTGITMDQLSNALPFIQVFDAFIAFIDEMEMSDTCLCSWGMVDIRAMFKMIKYHDLDMNALSKQYINLQSFVSKHFKCSGGKNIGLRTAVELLKIPQNRAFHDALSDAFYTKEVFRHLYDDISIEPSLYDYNFHPSRELQKQKKTVLDEQAFYSQIEKMFESALSEENKSMLKLAYVMGKTGQFQVEAGPKDVTLID